MLFDGYDISANLTEINSTYERNDILLMHSSDNETIASLNGVSVMFGLSGGGLLNFVLTVPMRLRDSMEGLMGDFDGNSTNDFVNRWGYMLKNDANDSTIHYSFGVTCEFYIV